MRSYFYGFTQHMGFPRFQEKTSEEFTAWTIVKQALKPFIYSLKVCMI